MALLWNEQRTGQTEGGPVGGTSRQERGYNTGPHIYYACPKSSAFARRTCAHTYIPLVPSQKVQVPLQLLNVLLCNSCVFHG